MMFYTTLQKLVQMSQTIVKILRLLIFIIPLVVLQKTQRESIL